MSKHPRGDEHTYERIHAPRGDHMGTSPAKLFSSVPQSKRPRVLSSQSFYSTCLIPTFLSPPPSPLIMIFYSLILSLALLRLPSATARTFTVVNTCTYTIWYAPVYLVILSRRGPRRSDLSLVVIQACSECIPAITAFHRFLNTLPDLH